MQNIETDIDNGLLLLEDVVIKRWETSPCGVPKTSGHLEYQGIGVLPNGKELPFNYDEAFTRNGVPVPFTNPAQIKVGSRVKIMRVTNLKGDACENFIVVEE